MNKAKQGQSFLDKVVQFTGSFENALSAAVLSGKSITDNLTIGEDFKVGNITNSRVVDFFNEKNEPATAATIEVLVDFENYGIGLMEIENTFIVN